MWGARLAGVSAARSIGRHTHARGIIIRSAHADATTHAAARPQPLHIVAMLLSAASAIACDACACRTAGDGGIGAIRARAVPPGGG